MADTAQNSDSRESGSTDDSKVPLGPEPLYFPIIVIGILGLVGLLLSAFAFRLPHASSALTLLSVGILVVTASCLLGGGLGFLFALPRDLSRQVGPEPNGSAQKAADGDGTDPPNEAMRTGWANNNLIKVSDWLTTLIVGVTLVEFGDISEWLVGVGSTVGEAAGLKGPDAQTTFGVALILAGVSFGFLTGYVQTRTTVTRRLAIIAWAVEQGLRKDVAETKRTVNSMRNDLADAKSATASLQRRLEETAPILLSLYQPPPRGFEDAIAETRRLMDRDKARRDDAKLWAYLAFAYGQKYAYEQKKAESGSEADPDELKKIADKAFDAIKRCLELDPDQKHWLQTLWDPNDPGHSKRDDDLTPFYRDPVLKERFRTLLG